MTRFRSGEVVVSPLINLTLFCFPSKTTLPSTSSLPLTAIMHFFKFLLPLALTAEALLILPEVSDTPMNLDGNLLEILTHKQSVKIKCPDCPIALDGPSPNSLPTAWMLAGDNDKKLRSGLKLDFAVENNKLNMNGLQIFPPNPIGGIKAKQVTHMKGIKTFKGEIPLSTSIEHRPVEAIIGNDGILTVHPISVEILGLSEHVVRISGVIVRVAQLANGELRLLPLETTPYKSSPIADSCSNVLCRVKAIIASKIAAFRAAAAARFGAFRTGCMRKAGHRKGPHVVGGPNKFLGKDHSRHNFTHMFRHIIRHVILPIFFGISGGMIVGAFSFLIWTEITRMRAARRGVYESVEQLQEEGLVSMDGPPKYEEVYKESEDDVIDEKKELLEK